MSKLKKALMKAKAQRDTGAFPESTPAVKTLRSAKDGSPAFRLKRTEKEDLKITYKDTRVQPVDPSTLKRNKVFSLFKNSRTSNEIEILRTQILHQLQRKNGNSLLVTSARPGEGKTFTSINLAVSIVQQLDKSVLLVDADMRNPWKHHRDFATDFFGIETKSGLADYLIGKVKLSEVLINPGIDKLTILPAGHSLPNSSELLGSSKMEEFILEAKKRYGMDRIVIFDSPALLACTDPLVFSQFIDGVLLVVEAEKTSSADLKRVMELLKDKPLIGTVLNKRKGV